MKTLARILVASLLLCAAMPSVAIAQKVDRVTAGGFITGTPSGARANFGVNARNPVAPSGHLNYVDHGISMHVVSTAITAYTIVDATTRTIAGTCTIDGVAGFTFTATLTDLGEPGTSDTFALSLSNGYTSSGTLVGGNVQVHPVP
jgi:hypothetical protein